MRARAAKLPPPPLLLLLLLPPPVLALGAAAAGGLKTGTLRESQLFHPLFVRQEELRLPSMQLHGFVWL